MKRAAFNFGLAGWVLGMAWASSDAGVGIVDLLAFLAGTALAVLVWGIRTALATRAWLRARRSGASFGWRILWREPAAVLLGAFLLFSPLSLVARLLLAAPWLAPFVEDVRHSGSPASPGWIGPLHALEIETSGDAVRIITSECGVVDNCGVVYSPAGSPKRVGDDYYSHLWGPWWHWSRSF